MRHLLLIMLFFARICAAQASQPDDLNTELMETTFRINGQTATGVSTGTGFLLGRHLSQPNLVRVVLVTAAHVLSDMLGDSVVLMVHRQSGQGAQEIALPVPIRSSGHTLWVHHPTADVAALYITIPTELMPTSVVPVDVLATDKSLADYEIHPGDELNVLGYPLGFENVGGFPVLRSGKIASYPLVPTAENPFFLLDFRVFKGNSGGPAYFVQSNRIYKRSPHLGVIQLIMGLVSEEVSATEQFRGLYENRSQIYPLGLAKIVPAPYIAETINLLPLPK